MSLGESLQKRLKSIKDRLGLGELEEEDILRPLDIEGTKGFSDFTLRVDLPTISIIQGMPLAEANMPVVGGLAPADLARLGSIERKLDDIGKRIRKLTDFGESNRIELEQHSESIAYIEGKVSEMDRIMEEYSSVEKNHRELAVLYDLISAQCNPFIELSYPGIALNPGGENNSRKEGEDTGTLLLDWMKFLLQRIPHANIPKLMDYYQEIGLIDNGLIERVGTYLKGLKLEEGKAAKEGDWRLTPDDQARSMGFIKKLMRREV
ncbi:MAG: hypothetical protein KAU14_05065 [Thermoplasmata archaeon]|nr:hypothetical protein [Thermoplasmata archaeon]